MVSTRNHPKAFPAPQLSPTKSSAVHTGDSTDASTSAESSPAKPTSQSTPNRKSTAYTSTTSRRLWSHTPSHLTLIWLALSLPLVVWDTGYVLLRPYSMPGGALHWPLWEPYELYGTVDYVYGWPAWNNKNGFTGAQGTLNAVETAGYFIYLWIVLRKGVESDVKGRGAPDVGVLGRLAKARTVKGKDAGLACLVAFAMAVMTLSKTVLYWLNEYFSGFDNIGHNDATTLVFLWILPNGLWLIFPTYMIYVFGREILQGLDIASGETSKKTQ